MRAAWRRRAAAHRRTRSRSSCRLCPHTRPRPCSAQACRPQRALDADAASSSRNGDSKTTKKRIAVVVAVVQRDGENDSGQQQAMSELQSKSIQETLIVMSTSTPTARKSEKTRSCRSFSCHVKLAIHPKKQPQTRNTGARKYCSSFDLKSSCAAERCDY